MRRTSAFREVRVPSSTGGKQTAAEPRPTARLEWACSRPPSIIWNEPGRPSHGSGLPRGDPARVGSLPQPRGRRRRCVSTRSGLPPSSFHTFPNLGVRRVPARSVACHRRCLSLVASSVVAPRSPPRSLPTARPAYRAITSLFLLSPRAVSSVLLAHEPPTRATRRPAPTLRRRRSTRAHSPRAGKHGVRPA